MGVVLRKRKDKSYYEVNYSHKRVNYYGGTYEYSKRGYKQAKAKYDQLVKDVNSGKLNKVRTFGSVCNEFMNTASVDYQENTVTLARHYINSLKEFFEVDITKIDTSMLQAYFNRRKGESLEANKTIRKILNRVFEYALLNSYVAVNPCYGLKIKGVVAHRESSNIITYTELNELVEALESRNTFNYRAYSVAVQIAYFTGLRVSEVLALNKSDIDINSSVITVNKKLVYEGLKVNEIHASNEMKTAKSCAVLPLCETLKSVLVEWFRVNSFEKVVCDSRGRYLSPDYMNKKIKAVANTLDIDYHFHALRHSYITNLIESGVDVATVKELARHSSIKTTVDIYTHISIEKKKEAVNSAFRSVPCMENTFNTESVNRIN